jgi:hypothetical protein
VTDVLANMSPKVQELKRSSSRKSSRLNSHRASKKSSSIKLYAMRIEENRANDQERHFNQIIQDTKIPSETIGSDSYSFSNTHRSGKKDADSDHIGRHRSQRSLGSSPSRKSPRKNNEDLDTDAVYLSKYN